MARLFTVSEVNALIPRLTREFEALSNAREEARRAREALATLETKGRSNGKDLATEIRERQHALEEIGRKANVIIEGIGALGCDVKDVEQGLVDFPATREGRIVYLCWKLGEDEIRFWHELSTGFAGRQPL